MKLGWFAGAVLSGSLGLVTVASAQNVAIVNGKAVPSSRVDAFISQVQKSGRPIDDKVRAQIREEVINREIFMQEAQRLGLDTSADYRIQLELNRQAILIRALFEDFSQKNLVTEAEAKAEYDKFASARSGKEYRARHILVDKEDEAKAIIASLKKGAKFEEIAKKQSKDPGSAANGGDLDWANAGSYVKEFSDAMVKLNKGQITDTPVKSQFGFHIIRLDDTRDAQIPPFDQVKAQIQQQMQQQRLQNYQQELIKKAKIE